MLAVSGHHRHHSTSICNKEDRDIPHGRDEPFRPYLCCTCRLAFGVLLAYSCCQALFAMLRLHSRSLQPGTQNNAVEVQAQAS